LHRFIYQCRLMDMKEVAAACRLLGDEARLRLLRLLSVERLNVSELTAILGLAQSGVSRHLGLLRDAGLVAESREGGFAYYRLADATSAGPLWAALAPVVAAADGAAARADQARLKEVLRLRRERFDAHRIDNGQLVPGRSWAAWARALGHLLPPLRVADLGCGEGYLTVEAARWATEVVAVDRSAGALREARALAARRRADNIVWKRGEIEDLPLAARSVDVALLSQALHHAERPERAIGEAVRVLAPGGRLLVLDLRTHDQAWVRERLGDRWLGFDDATLAGWLRDAGLADVRVEAGARLRGNPFTVLVASGAKPAADATRARSPKRRTSSRTAA
jgi:SAM-dependent methyltransferase